MKFVLLSSIILLSCLSCADHTGEEQNAQNYQYHQSDSILFQSIVEADAKYFTAYNTCDMETQASMYVEDLEFYHDKGGLVTSKADLLVALERNICNKVTRTLVPGSIEVYPIPEFGAIQLGLHLFHNKEEPDAPSKPSRFVTVWKRGGKFGWQMARVISLH